MNSHIPEHKKQNLYFSSILICISISLGYLQISSKITVQLHSYTV